MSSRDAASPTPARSIRPTSAAANHLYPSRNGSRNFKQWQGGGKLLPSSMMVLLVKIFTEKLLGKLAGKFAVAYSYYLLSNDF